MEVIYKKVESPSLRFREFLEEWKPTKLKTIVEYIDSGWSPQCHDYPADDQNWGVLRTSAVTKDGFKESENKKLPSSLAPRSELEIRKDDILITRAGPTLRVGIVAYVKDVRKKLLISDKIIRIRTNASNSNEFISKILGSNKIHRRILRKTSGLAKSQTNVSQKNLLNTLIIIPTLKEQQKIASFISTLDKRIYLLEKKKTKLEEYKKGVIRKIFKREIRFKNENGKEFPEWRKNKLNEVVQKFIVPMRDKPKDLTGSIPWCRIEDFNGMYLSTSKSSQGVSEEVVNNMNLKVFPKGTLLVSCSAYLGRCAIVQEELITNQTFIGLYPKSDVINVEYLYYSMIKSERKLNRLSSGTTISYLSREEFENFQLEYPCIEEQSKIASFLTSIDKKIEMVEQQIEGTNQFKKGLLQQMFV